MSTHAEFQLRREAAAELKRLAAHPRGEVKRLEDEAREGGTAASLGIIVAAVFLGVWTIAALLYGVVLLAVRLATG
jgi:hypothetical protein